MKQKRLGKRAIRAETNRLLDKLAWLKSKNGFEMCENKDFSDPIFLTTSMLEILIFDAEDRGYNIARILASLLLQIWSCSDDQTRDKLEKLMAWDGKATKGFMDRRIETGRYKEGM